MEKKINGFRRNFELYQEIKSFWFLKFHDIKNLLSEPDKWTAPWDKPFNDPNSLYMAEYPVVLTAVAPDDKKGFVVALEDPDDELYRKERSEVLALIRYRGEFNDFLQLDISLNSFSPDNIEKAIAIIRLYVLEEYSYEKMEEYIYSNGYLECET